MYFALDPESRPKSICKWDRPHRDWRRSGGQGEVVGDLRRRPRVASMGRE
jgi:hypothetical protein